MGIWDLYGIAPLALLQMGMPLRCLGTVAIRVLCIAGQLPADGAGLARHGAGNTADGLACLRQGRNLVSFILAKVVVGFHSASSDWQVLRPYPRPLEPPVYEAAHFVLESAIGKHRLHSLTFSFLRKLNHTPAQQHS